MRIPASSLRRIVARVWTAGLGVWLGLACGSSEEDPVAAHGEATETGVVPDETGASTDDLGSETGTEGDHGSDNAMKVGLCTVAGRAVVDAHGYRGTHSFSIVADEGRGVPVCQVTVSITSTGQSSAECGFSGFACDWAYELAWSEARIEIDDGGACAESEVAWHSEAVHALESRRQTLGLVSFPTNHDPLLLELDDGGMWQLSGIASWSAATGELSYGHADGLCWYR